MKSMYTQIKIVTVISSILLLSISALSYGASLSMSNNSNRAEISVQYDNEGAEVALDSDTIVVGELNGYSSKAVKVNGYDYYLCMNLEIYNLGEELMPLSDLGSVIKVKLFVNEIGCVRKINALSFAE